MEHEFKEGEVVVLKSGGPRMTIEGIGKYGPGATKDNANCIWFEGTKRHEAIFELSTLMPVPQNTTATHAVRLQRG